MTETNFDVHSLREDYKRDGFCVVPHLFGAEECEAWKGEALRLRNDRSVASPSSTVIVGGAVRSPLFYALSEDERVVAILRALMPDGIEFMSDKIVFKSADRAFATPWHYDAAYWPETRPKMSVWIALDEVDESNGALKVLPRSQTREWVHSQGDLAETNNEFGNVITPDWGAEQEVICALPQGGAIFFSDRLLHASCENSARADRYSIISTYHAPGEEAFDLHFPARHVIEAAPETLSNIAEKS